ncbi:MAG TPA: precorrin-6y C5,15-methyltransferase (decarboxylating) subunit CbiE [Stellaceae bacterium]|jgi:precorrin-6Y C5,15-methyltransferase (decarboxylating)
MTAWLAVIGIGEDGWAGLSDAAKALVGSAALIVGGARHLALVPSQNAERMAWKSPLAETVPLIAEWRGRRVAVLASGDPLCYGVGALLARNFAPEEMIVLPQPSAFSLAATRLLWPLEECMTVSLHGRPLDQLRLHLAPDARILTLTEDGTTPAKIAALLTEAGWGATTMTVLEHLGGARERRIMATAAAWCEERCADLNIVALDCRAGPEARSLSRRAGLPDDAFRHDGQITKRAVRAATLAALAPLPGELLWDIGAGSGSIAIEWLRADRRMSAVAIERDPARVAVIVENAALLGVPQLAIVQAAAPEALAGLAPPDAIFIGGGVSNAANWDAAWPALKPGGRLVANAVTVRGEAELLRRHSQLGGELQRISVSQAEGQGFWRPAMTVTQLAARKPR